MIWNSSIYRFITPDPNVEDDGWKEVLVDVTASAPTFADPGKTLGSVLDEVSEMLPGKDRAEILDFGAGKLRNTVFLLEKGHRVCSVEFEKMKAATDQAATMYSRAEEFGDQFWTLVFPHEFTKSEAKFSLILLVNVCNIMPVEAERLLVLQHCTRKLDRGGLVLWYTQHRDQKVLAKCLPEVRLGDGYYMNADKRYQTFYRDFEPHEIDQMFLATGFRLKRKIQASRNQARLYYKSGKDPLRRSLSATKIRRYVVGDRDLPERESPGVRARSNLGRLKENIPNPDPLRCEQLFLEALKKLPAGPGYQTEYHNLMAAVLTKLFVPPLKGPMVERGIKKGMKRVDILMRNSSEGGFFAELSSIHEIPAPYIPIECKNYKTDIKNEEVDQLAGRFGRRVGQFGVITYRRNS
ncbi:MAG: hypothetical protein ACE5IJ_06320, partial [Thermoplasmata archaeon]